MMRRTGSQLGFTLIELLVVVAVIALLIGLLLPALGNARAVSQLLVNKSNQRQLLVGQIAKSVDQQGEYPSVNTGVNAELVYTWRVEGTAAADARMEGDQSPTTPTSLVDWISPSMGNELNLSSNRAERTFQIFSEFVDPAATRINDLLWGSSGDYADFSQIQRERGYPQMSYLAPYTFHYANTFDSDGDGRGGESETTLYVGQYPRSHPAAGRPVLGFSTGFGTPYDTPRSFSPKIEKVGAPSEKIMLADGTRFWTGSVLDFDVNPTPSIYGSFTSGTPIRSDSTAYERPTQIVFSDGFSFELEADHWKFSVRHLGHTRMVAAFFDGHVEDLTIEQAYGNVDIWAPSGSIMRPFSDITPEARTYIEGALDGQWSSSNPYIVR